MKKYLKRTCAVITAGLFSTLSMASQMMNTGAYYAGQQHTWRFFEKYSGVGLEWYFSSAINKNGYTFGTVEQGNISQGVFDADYDSAKNELGCVFFSLSPINSSWDLSQSTWYTSTAVTSFSLDYSYETNNGAVIGTMSVLIGDVNRDGRVDTLDSKMIAAQLLPTHPTLTEQQVIAADVNNNGEIDLYDCIQMEQFILGDINHF